MTTSPGPVVLSLFVYLPQGQKEGLQKFLDVNSVRESIKEYCLGLLYNPQARNKALG